MATVSCTSALGALTQIAASSAVDAYLQGDFSFFRAAHRRYSPFALLQMLLTAQGSFNWNSSVQFPIPKSLDYLLGGWVQFLTPALTVVAGTYAYFTNFLVAQVCRTTQLNIGPVSASGVITSYAYDVVDELWFGPGMKFGAFAGKRATTAQLIADASAAQVLWLKLIFANSLFLNYAVPLVSAPLTNFTVCIETCQASDIVVTDGTAQTPAASDYQMQLLIEGAMVNGNERTMLQTAAYDVVYMQWQNFQQPVPAAQSNMSVYNITMQSFRFPVRAVAWMFLNNASITAKNYFAYSNPTTRETLVINQQQRVPLLQSNYFYGLQPQDHANCIPDKYIHMYSFSTRACEPQTQGTYNYTRQSDSALQVQFDGTNLALQVNFVVWSMNVLRFQRNIGYVVFGS
jgi:hypothetical protein